MSELLLVSWWPWSCFKIVFVFDIRPFQDLVRRVGTASSSLMPGFTQRPLVSVASAGSSVLLRWHQILGLSMVPTSQVSNMGFRTWARDSCWSWGRVAVWCGNWIDHEISLMDSSPGVCWGGPRPSRWHWHWEASCPSITVPQRSLCLLPQLLQGCKSAFKWLFKKFVRDSKSWKDENPVGKSADNSKDRKMVSELENPYYM